MLVNSLRLMGLVTPAGRLLVVEQQQHRLLPGHFSGVLLSQTLAPATQLWVMQQSVVWCLDRAETQ
jgi:hypothetical protein